MRAKLLALLLLITQLAITHSVINTHGKNPARTNQETNLGHGPKIRYINESQVWPLDVGAVQSRFADGDWYNSLGRAQKGTAPVAGVKADTDPTLFDYFDVGEDDEEKEDDDDDDNDDEEEQEDGDEDDDDDEDYDEDDVKKKKKKKNPQILRGGRRKHVRAHKIIFPLLLAYKLKFFTMLPLLVGSLVLLVGTTGIAGFFFALFSAALGLQVKPRH